MGLKMREIGFQRTYIFKIFRGSMPPDPTLESAPPAHNYIFNHIRTPFGKPQLRAWCVSRMLLVCTRMLLVFTLMLFVCMLLVCTCMLLVCSFSHDHFILPCRCCRCLFCFALFFFSLLKQDNFLPHILCRPCEEPFKNCISVKMVITESHSSFETVKRCTEISPSVPRS